VLKKLKEELTKEDTKRECAGIYTIVNTARNEIKVQE